jgi:RNA polymerase sigma factor (sigma-70 family)
MLDHSTESAFLPLLEKMRAGDDAALTEFLERVSDRLRTLTRAMLRKYPGVKRWEETDDVMQNALVRLLRALKEVHPDSLQQFYGLASLQIRRELIDLARHYYGPMGQGANHASHAQIGSSFGQRLDPADQKFEPAQLAEWCELHGHIDGLPDNERAVIDLIFYQGLTQQEAAELLEVSVRTVQRRWHAALLKLHAILNEDGN